MSKELQTERVCKVVIEVLLVSSLRKYASSFGNVITADVSDDIDIKELLSELEINSKEVRKVQVNGITANWDKILFDGDRVSIFP